MTRKKLYLRQAARCFYCQQPMDWQKYNKATSPNGFTDDHFIPKVLGGGLAGRKVLAHMKCNSRKGSRLPTEQELERYEAIYGSRRTAAVRKEIAAIQRRLERKTA